MPPEAKIRQSVVVPGTAEAVREVGEQIIAKAREYEYGQNDVFAIRLALEEAFINAIKHGNKMDPAKQVKIDYSVSADKVDISITDQGGGFDTQDLPDPRVGDNLYKSNGRGLFLMRSYMDIVEFNDAGNCVHMVRRKENKGD